MESGIGIGVAMLAAWQQTVGVDRRQAPAARHQAGTEGAGPIAEVQLLPWRVPRACLKTLLPIPTLPFSATLPFLDLVALGFRKT